MPCGFDVKRALQDVPLLAEREGWESLPAIRNNRVYAIDAGAYTSPFRAAFSRGTGNNGGDDTSRAVLRPDTGVRGAAVVRQRS